MKLRGRRVFLGLGGGWEAGCYIVVCVSGVLWSWVEFVLCRGSGFSYLVFLEELIRIVME